MSCYNDSLLSALVRSSNSRIRDSDHRRQVIAHHSASSRSLSTRSNHNISRTARLRSVKARPKLTPRLPRKTRSLRRRRPRPPSSKGSNEPQCRSPPPPPAPSIVTGLDSCQNKNTNAPVGGRLQQFWHVWHHLGASHKVVRWLRYGYPLPFYKNDRGLPLSPPLRSVPPKAVLTCYADPGKHASLLQAVDLLLTKQAIREIPHSDPVYFNRVFLVPKKNGKLRLVTDLSQLNTWVDCPSFRMDHAQVVRDALSPGMWATSIDLSDAYLHIPIHPSCWKYLTFQIGSKRY